ncbi:MAG TPA: preprotein translocase subunit SecG [Nitrospiraceae bacterium]|nr:preprotein translocase subunit SecG [Nitrospiraceae bacterium]
MYTLAVIIHVIVCFLMIASILLQAGKGAEIGAAFGGSSQTVFGSRGPGTFLSKVTIGAAVIFMLTSLGLALLSKERTFSSTVIDLNKKETAPILPQGSSDASKADTSKSDASKPATSGESQPPAPATAH